MENKQIHYAEKEIKALVEGNIEYRQKYSGLFESLKLGQTPGVTVLTCSDSRVPASIFGIESLNQIFLVKNIGNQIENSEGSIKYPLLHLKTPLFVVMGHTGCGAIKAATSDYTEEDDAIQHEIIGLKAAIREAREKPGNAHDDQMMQAIISETNVDMQVASALSDAVVKALVDSGKLFIVGMVFDIHDIYQKGTAHLFITNINGETSTEKIRMSRLLSDLTQKDIAEYVKRLSPG